MLLYIQSFDNYLQITSGMFIAVVTIGHVILLSTVDLSSPRTLEIGEETQGKR
jgi:hypothetical protein